MADYHTRFVFTELICKSFWTLRGDDALFGTVRLLDRSRGDGWCIRLLDRLLDPSAILPPLRCKAEHWANVVQVKANLLTSIDLSGYVPRLDWNSCSGSPHIASFSSLFVLRAGAIARLLSPM